MNTQDTKTDDATREVKTIDLTPSWESAVRIYIQCLKNPDASAEAHKSAETDLLRLARMVDEHQKGNDNDNGS